MKSQPVSALFLSDSDGWDTSDGSFWSSLKRLWTKKLRNIKNGIKQAIYPVPLQSLWAVMAFVLGLEFANVKLPFHGLIARVLPASNVFVTGVVLSLIVWSAIVLFIRTFLKALLAYRGWLTEERGKGRSVSLATKLWHLSLKLVSSLSTPMLYSFQGALPRLSVPSVEGSVQRYLRSQKPLLDDVQYARTEKLAQEFKDTISAKLQRYLVLKSWWSSNFVSDWWEEHVYLSSRSPLMVNSNFYIIDSLATRTGNQAARVATIVHAALCLRRLIERRELPPIMIQGLIPLCMWQYERLFNTSRVPGVDKDEIVHYNYSKHIVVYHKGRYFKVPVYFQNRILLPSEIEIQINHILQDNSAPAVGEERLAALTAGERTAWALARQEFFSSGVNRTSLEAVDKAAFFVTLDDFPYEYHQFQDQDKLDSYGRTLFHGKGYDRWFDKTFTFCCGTDGRAGLNCEHSWGDGSVMSHFCECVILDEYFKLGYTAEGRCRGTPECDPPTPTRLRWELPPQALSAIDRSYQVALAIINDLDLRLFIHTAYGKGFIKRCKVGPDGFIQMAIQLAYYRDAGKVCLTYETGTTRLYREGRTDTVRPCTLESTAWVKTMLDETASIEEKVRMLRKACQNHQKIAQEVMCGKGVDRHLFCLYVISKYLKIESPFLQCGMVREQIWNHVIEVPDNPTDIKKHITALSEALSAPWTLSTSQTPHSQTDKVDLQKHPGFICGGGGFGPAAQDGYGVSYIITGEDMLFFHVTAHKSSSLTDAKRFTQRIEQAMADMKDLFLDWENLQNKQ